MEYKNIRVSDKTHEQLFEFIKFMGLPVNMAEFMTYATPYIWESIETIRKKIINDWESAELGIKEKEFSNEPR